MNLPPVPSRRHARCAFSALLVAAVATALAACQSPLTSDFNTNWGGTGGLANAHDYTNSIVGRTLLDVTAGQPNQSGTLNGGVRELARVDAVGPGGLVIEEPPGFSVTEHPTIESAGRVGLPSAALNLPEATIPLSLQEAIVRTARHSLAIRVEGYNPAIKETQIIQAMAAFDAVFFAQSQWSNTDEPQISPAFSNGQTWQHQIGVRKLLPSGGQIQASVGSTFRDITLPPFSTIPLKTSYTSNINLQLTQPLLRGFGSDVSSANIYLAQADLRVSLSEFKQRVITSVADVEEAYYTLIQARTNVDTLVRLVVATEQTYNLVRERIPIDVTRASLFQANSALESRRASLQVAQKAYRRASDHLKALMNDPDFDVRNNTLIIPTDRPMVEPLYYNYLDSLMTGLSQRPEMQQSRLQIERANIVISVAKNDLLPKLDLVVGMQTNGLDNSFEQSLNTTINPANFLDFNAGLKLEMPIGNREAAARFKQRELERQQQISNFVLAAQRVVEDIRTQLREMLSSYEEIAIRDRVRQASAQEFAGIIDIEEIRQRTPEFLQLKLDSQARLADAEQQLTAVIINYNLAIMRLEQAKGTLLEFNRIALDHPPTTPDDIDAGKIRLLGKTILDK